MKFILIAILVTLLAISAQSQSCTCDAGSSYDYNEKACRSFDIELTEILILNCSKISSTTETSYIGSQTTTVQQSCTECANGFWRQSVQSCIANLENCSTQTTFDSCDRCATNYFIDVSENNHCTKVTTPVDNCEIHDGLTTCQLCKPGFYPESNSKCTEVTPKIDNVYRYATATTISACKDKYHQHSTLQYCVANLSHCDVSTTTGAKDSFETVCDQCENGTDVYYWDNATGAKKCVINTSQGSLDKAIEGCAYYREGATGPECLRGDGVKRYIGTTIEINDNVSFDKCARFNDVDNCYECKSGHSLWGNECFAYPTKDYGLVSNCLTYSNDVDNVDDAKIVQVCTQCKSGYFGEKNGRGFISKCVECGSTTPLTSSSDSDSEDDDESAAIKTFSSIALLAIIALLN